MKKYLRYADVLVLFTGALGLLLRLMVLLGGTDEKELYPAAHPGFVLACVLAVVMVGALWFFTRQAGNDGRYETNFPRSIAGAVGCLLAAAAILVTALDMPNGKWLSVFCALAGVAAAVGLTLAALLRFLGKKMHFACMLLPCVFFTLRVFLLGQTLGAEPEAFRYLFEMMTNLALIPACYQLWGFTVDLGDRRKCLFWCLTAAFLSMVSLPNPDSWLLHLGVAAWLMTNLIPLQPMELPVHTQEELPQEAEAEEPAEDVAEMPQTREELEPIDVDAILADIMKEIDKTAE